MTVAVVMEENTSEIVSVNSDNVLSSEKKSAKKSAKLNNVDDLKIVIRKLPPTMTEVDFLEQVAPLAEHDYLSFMQADYSYGVRFASNTAYIHFMNLDDLIAFKDKFDNYIFLDSRGNEYVAIVELAPYQHVPNVQKIGKKRCPLVNTIEADPLYQKFVEEQAIKPVSENKIEFDIKLNETKKPVLTPLLEYVNKRRMNSEGEYGRGHKRMYERRFRTTRSTRNRNFSRSSTSSRGSRKSLKADKRKIGDGIVEDIEGEEKKTISEDEFHSAESDNELDDYIEEEEVDDEDEEVIKVDENNADKENIATDIVAAADDVETCDIEVNETMDLDNYDDYNDNDDDDIMDELIEEDVEDFDDSKHQRLSYESKDDVKEEPVLSINTNKSMFETPRVLSSLSSGLKAVTSSAEKSSNRRKTIYNMSYKQPLVKIKSQDYEYTQRFNIHYHYFNNYYNTFKEAYNNYKSQSLENTSSKTSTSKMNPDFANITLNMSFGSFPSAATNNSTNNGENVNQYRSSRTSARHSESTTKFQLMMQEVVLNNNQVDPSVR